MIGGDTAPASASRCDDAISADGAKTRRRGESYTVRHRVADAQSEARKADALYAISEAR